MSSYTPNLLRPSTPDWLEKTCQRLQENDATLSTLDLSHPRLDDVFARLVSQSLGENQVVTTVILSCFDMVDDGAHAMGNALRRLSQLTKLQLRDLRNQREINIFFDLLARHGDIEELSLRHVIICIRSVKCVINFIRCHRKLRELRIVDSQIDDASVQEIFEAVNGHVSLKRMYFINVSTSSIALTTGVTSMLEMTHESKLEEIHLCENDIEDEGTSAIASSVVQNKTLRSLNLRSNGITHIAAHCLQKTLVASRYLKTLDISHNEISDLGAIALARGLAHSQCILENLDLSENCIGTRGILAVAMALPNNLSLSNLRVSFNLMGDEGATALAAALVRNRTLRCIDMRRCGITDQGAREIARYMSQMKALKDLVLANNAITSVGSTDLLHSLRQNVEIEYLTVSIQDKVSDPISREIMHWIRLNKAGRRIFHKMNDVPASLWPHVYCRILDTSLLYHFVASNPGLIDRSVERLQKKKLETL